MLARAIPLLCLLPLLAPLAATAAPGDLTVSRITGTATLGGGAGAKPVSPGRQLKGGDVLTAGSRSRAGLSFGQGGSFVLAGLSELQVYEASAGNGRTPPLAKLKLLAGALRVNSAPGKTRVAQDVRLNVGALKTRIFGAEVWGASTAEGDTVCLLSGAVEIQTRSGAAPERLTDAGSCLRRDAEGRVARLVAASDAILPAAIAATAFAPEASAVAAAPAPAPVAPPMPPVPPRTVATAPMAPITPPAAPRTPAPNPPPRPTLPPPATAAIVPPPPPPSAYPRPAPPPPSPKVAEAPRVVPSPARSAPSLPPPAASTQGQIVIQTPVQTIVQSAPAARPTPPAAGRTPPPRPPPARPAETEVPAAAPRTAPAGEPARAETTVAMRERSTPPRPARSSGGGKGGWTVVVSSSANKGAAEARTRALQDEGYVANLREAEVKGQRTYRITVGEFGSRDEAQAYSERTLAKAGMKGWLSPL